MFKCVNCLYYYNIQNLEKVIVYIQGRVGHNLRSVDDWGLLL